MEGRERREGGIERIREGDMEGGQRREGEIYGGRGNEGGRDGGRGKEVRRDGGRGERRDESWGGLVMLCSLGYDDIGDGSLIRQILTHTQLSFSGSANTHV